MNDSKFSENLKAIIIDSEKEATLLGHETIKTAHYLLAIIKHKTNSAAHVLDTQIDTQKLQTHIKKLYPTQINKDKKLELKTSIQAKEALKGAFNLSGSFKRKYVGTEHLLLSILQNNNDPCTKLIQKLGADYKSIAEALDKKIHSEIDSIFSIIESIKVVPKNEPTKKIKKPFLEQFGKNLTKMAQTGKLDPVIGREPQIARISQVLSRRKKNNVMIIGEPGVGKSAIVEALAIQMHHKYASETFRNKNIISLNVNDLVAGTKYRGKFEERIKVLLKEIRNNPYIILFIDEIHNIIGAGSVEGSGDLANLLKPALEKGELQCIGATTSSEYRKYFEKDGALERRFQKIIIEPTTIKQTIEILKNIKIKYENYHKVHYTKEALESCVMLTEQYITHRNLPDKAIDALDEAGAKANIHRKIKNLKENKNHQEKIIIKKSDIVEIVAAMSNIPFEKIKEQEITQLKNLPEKIKKQIIGQNAAVETLCKALQRSRLGLKDPNKPIGCFLFLGQTGVGKTKLSKVLAKEFFKHKNAFIRIDMNEYMEKISVSKFIGAAPGYVGYEEGGQLTEKIHKTPYSLLLLDEIEKAHKDVCNILLQILDEGFVVDSSGKKVDFRNTIIIMTSNIGSKKLGDFGNGIGFGTDSEIKNNKQRRKDILKKELKKYFAPEFLNRIDDTLIFEPLEKEDILKIVSIEANKLLSRIESLGYGIKISAKAKQYLANIGYSKEYGARPIKRILEHKIGDAIINRILDKTFKTGDTLKIDLHNEKLSFKKITPLPALR